MKAMPVDFTKSKTCTQSSLKDFIPVTVRHNSLLDIDFNLIADVIKIQNLKNQTNIKILTSAW